MMQPQPGPIAVASSTDAGRLVHEDRLGEEASATPPEWIEISKSATLLIHSAWAAGDALARGSRWPCPDRCGSCRSRRCRAGCRDCAASKAVTFITGTITSVPESCAGSTSRSAIWQASGPSGSSPWMAPLTQKHRAGLGAVDDDDRDLERRAARQRR